LIQEKGTLFPFRSWTNRTGAFIVYTVGSIVAIILTGKKYTPNGDAMDSIDIFTTALQYEEKIRDLYVNAAETVDDERGRAIFRALAADEQGHIEFLNYSLDRLSESKPIDIERLSTSIPDKNSVIRSLDRIKAKIPERMLGDIKTVLRSALAMEKETSAYYRQSAAKTEGAIKAILEKFLIIEIRHEDVVQTELDHAQHNGIWFNFMEVDLEVESD
jgi:rubrerythrin